MTDDDNDKEPVSLGDFVDPDYPQSKRRILEQGLTSLRGVLGQRDWEHWLGVYASMRIIAEEVCAQYRLDPRGFDTSKGSVFQTAFLKRWKQYETLARRNDAISAGERSFLLYLVKNPEALDWRKGQPPQKQRKMIHPSNVVAGWKAAQREKHAETSPSPKDRIIAELDQRADADAETIRRLQGEVESFIWKARDDIEPLRKALKARVLNLRADEQAEFIKAILKDLGFNFDLIARLLRGRS